MLTKACSFQLTLYCYTLHTLLSCSSLERLLMRNYLISKYMFSHLYFDCITMASHFSWSISWKWSIESPTTRVIYGTEVIIIFGHPRIFDKYWKRVTPWWVIAGERYLSVIVLAPPKFPPGLPEMFAPLPHYCFATCGPRAIHNKIILK